MGDSAGFCIFLPVKWTNVNFNAYFKSALMIACVLLDLNLLQIYLGFVADLELLDSTPCGTYSSSLLICLYMDWAKLYYMHSNPISLDPILMTRTKEA